MQRKEDAALFVYYKAYRANIRAKVNSLRAINAAATAEKKHALNEVYKYLLLMNDYIQVVSDSGS
jgi:aminoglycoside phosphotransferase family enzyme